MPKVFISYRRVDSQWVVDAIYSQMRQILGAENIFLDVDDIPPGVDFRVFLHDQIAQTDVVLVIIGPDWARIMKERAKQANDFVRIEVENALQQGKLVIPVLVMDAEIPDFSELPESVQDLQWRNVSRIRRHPDMEGDCVRLATGISRAMESLVSRTSPRSLDLMPQPFEWIEISGGRGTLKTDNPDVTLPIPTEAYWISKYPVTNAQFEKFMDAGGYNNDRWWTKQGWEYRQKEDWTEPRYWTNSQFNGEEQPVVGVSWFEAVAFCLWLSDAIGEKIMLPREAQWQYAAQGSDGRVYPWGNDWNPDFCNNNVDDKDIGKTTSVRQYEGQGDSPFGVVDMVGNVWEWCLTDYKNNMNDVNSDAPNRVLRGGSWNIDDRRLRTAYRYDFLQHGRNYHIGFRCARSY